MQALACLPACLPTRLPIHRSIMRDMKCQNKNIIIELREWTDEATERAERTINMLENIVSVNYMFSDSNDSQYLADGLFGVRCDVVSHFGPNTRSHRKWPETGKFIFLHTKPNATALITGFWVKYEIPFWTICNLTCVCDSRCDTEEAISLRDSRITNGCCKMLLITKTKKGKKQAEIFEGNYFICS